MPEHEGFTPDQAEGLDKTAAAESPAAAARDPYIDALLVERRGYLIYGRTDRVAAVDEQLALRGYQEAAQARAEAAPKSTRGRSTKPQQTT